MREYWIAVARKIPGALAETLFVAIFSLAPVLFGRMVLIFGPSKSAESYWAFLTNGQMAFYSMGSLASLLLICLRRKLPDAANVALGGITVLALLFLMVLVGVDPTLKASSFGFVGIAVLAIYGYALLARIIAEAMKGVDSGQALSAGSEAARNLTIDLAKRKAGGGA